MERVQPPPSTPIPPSELVRLIQELRALLKSIVTTGGEPIRAWTGLERLLDTLVTDRESLRSARAQLALVEDLADAIWEAAEPPPGLPAPGTGWWPGPGTGSSAAARRRLEAIADQLVEQVEAWQRPPRAG